MKVLLSGGRAAGCARVTSKPYLIRLGKDCRQTAQHAAEDGRKKVPVSPERDGPTRVQGSLTAAANQSALVRNGSSPGRERQSDPADLLE